MNDEHMRSISKEIHLDASALVDDPHSPFAILYKDPNFSFISMRYNVQNIVKAGFLLCKHYSKDSQELELWHMVNPTLEDTIGPHEVKSLMESLAYVAVDIQSSKYSYQNNL